MKAWITLITRVGYLPGLVALKGSLDKAGTRYPIIAMCTDGVDAKTRHALWQLGYWIREVAPVEAIARLESTFVADRFVDACVKLRAWQFDDLEMAVYLDADMLVLQNMDELFDIPLPVGFVAACHACRCNPHQIETYPADWISENCGYTHVERDGHTRTQATGADYFNAGIIVYRPDRDAYNAIVETTWSLGDSDEIAFADQDILNIYYREHWIMLPYVYNALKTLTVQHPGIWDSNVVKNVHYILDKPWTDRDTDGDPASYRELDAIWRQFYLDACSSYFAAAS